MSLWRKKLLKGVGEYDYEITDLGIQALLDDEAVHANKAPDE